MAPLVPLDPLVNWLPYWAMGGGSATALFFQLSETVSIVLNVVTLLRVCVSPGSVKYICCPTKW